MMEHVVLIWLLHFLLAKWKLENDSIFYISLLKLCFSNLTYGIIFGGARISCLIIINRIYKSNLTVKFSSLISCSLTTHSRFFFVFVKSSIFSDWQLFIFIFFTVIDVPIGETYTIIHGNDHTFNFAYNLF